MLQNLLTTLALLVTFAFPAIAGGPVLIEEATETAAAPAPGLTPGEKVGLAILGLIIIGAIAGGGSSDSGSVCFGDPSPPQPGC